MHALLLVWGQFGVVLLREPLSALNSILPPALSFCSRTWASGGGEKGMVVSLEPLLFIDSFIQQCLLCWTTVVLESQQEIVFTPDGSGEEV